MLKLSLFLPLFVAAFAVAAIVNISSVSARTEDDSQRMDVKKESMTGHTNWPRANDRSDDRPADRFDDGRTDSVHNPEGSTVRDANGPLPEKRLNVRQDASGS